MTRTSQSRTRLAVLLLGVAALSGLTGATLYPNLRDARAHRTFTRAAASASLSASETATLGLASITASPTLAPSLSYSTGTGNGQANLQFSLDTTLAASGSVNVDLYGSRTNGLGTTINCGTVKALALTAASGNTNNVVLGNATSNAFVGPMGATGTFAAKPGSFQTWALPNAGWAVTDATGDQLKIANSGAGSTVSFKLMVLCAA